MKKLVVIAIAVFVLITATTAAAQDKFLTAKVTKVTMNKDKNGNEYVRLSVETPKTLNGVSYTTTTAAMAFGDLVAKAKTLKPDTTLKMIVSEREFKGNASYTIIKFVE